MGPSRGELEGDVMAGVLDWINSVSQVKVALADRLGVAASDLDCLHVLRLAGPTTAAELAPRVGLTPGSVSRMIDRLERAGFVRRGADPGDRRRAPVEPTVEGLARIADAYANLGARAEEDLAGFSASELEVLRRFARLFGRSAAAELALLRGGPDWDGPA